MQTTRSLTTQEQSSTPNQQSELKYYHLQLKHMEVIRPEPPHVTLAAQRILDLDDLERQRRTDSLEQVTTLTAAELAQFQLDDRVLAQRYGVLAAGFAKDLLTLLTFLQRSRIRRQHFAFP